MSRDPRRASVERYSGWLTVAMGAALINGNQVKVLEALSGPGFDLVWILGLVQTGFASIILSYTPLVKWRVAVMAFIGVTWATIFWLMLDDGLYFVAAFMAPVVALFSVRTAWRLWWGTYGRD